MSRSFFGGNLVFDVISRLVPRVIVRGHAVKDIYLLVPVQWSVVGRQRVYGHSLEEKVSIVSPGPQYFYYFSESFDDLAPKKRWICNQYQINFVEPNFYFSVPGRYFGHDDSSWYGCNRDRVDKVSFHSSGGGASNLHTESRCGSKPTRKQIYMG